MENWLILEKSHRKPGIVRGFYVLIERQGKVGEF